MAHLPAPPKYAVPVGQTFRVTVPHAREQELLAIVNSYSPEHAYVYCKEGQQGTDVSEHFHVWFVPQTRGFKQHQLRYSLQKFAGKGNKSYSISASKDDVKCVAYFLKGGDYVIGEGVCPVLLGRARVHDRAAKARKVGRVDTRLNKAVAEIGDVVPIPGEDTRVYLTRLVGKVVDYLTKVGRLVDERSVMSIARTVMVASSPQTRSLVVENMVNKFSERYAMMAPIGDE